MNQFIDGFVLYCGFWKIQKKKIPAKKSEELNDESFHFCVKFMIDIS
jgi:hypothetical protein